MHATERCDNRGYGFCFLDRDLQSAIESPKSALRPPGLPAFFVIHFAMQLDGVQIDPKEWWGSHWIKNHIAKRPGGGKFKLLPNVSMANHFILGGS